MTTTASSTLLRKYDVQGPRYTSYPTILHWDANPTVEQWIGSIARGLDEAELRGGGAAIYVHMPFCRSLCTYCGCNTRITRHTEAARPYVQTVLKEWELYRERLNGTEPIPVSEIHLGGGTPTFLSPEALEELIGGILSHVRQTPDAEFSIEADPRTTTKEQLTTLARLGFRRLSLGIQDFDATVQEIVNRVQTEDEVRKVTECEGRQCLGILFNSSSFEGRAVGS